MTPDQMSAADHPSREQLLRVVRVQAQVARLGLDLPSVMQLVCVEALGLVAADGTVVELVEGSNMVYRAAAGLSEDQLGLVLPRAASLSGMAVAENRAMICTDTETDSRVNIEACRQVGVRSMVVIPLHHRGDTVGVLKAMARTPGRFDERDAQLLTMVTDVMAVALYLAQRFERSALVRQALRDPLTGLGNRAMFMERLRALASLAAKRGQRSALLLLDMDGLKGINDRHGHAAGDAALMALAARLQAAARPGDLVARLGGDEFALLMADIDDAALAGVQAAIQRELAVPVLQGDALLQVTASMGLARFPAAGTDVEALLALADAAMYADKRALQKSRRS